MDVYCRLKCRITKILRTSKGYEFYAKNGKCVAKIAYSEAEFQIPDIPEKALPWQYPVLKKMYYEKGCCYCRTLLNGRVLHSHEYKERTLLEKFVASYPENPEIETDINLLPSFYRLGLRALVFQKWRFPEERGYLSMLVWLNGLAAKIYRRYDFMALWDYGKVESDKVRAIRQAGLAQVLEEEAETQQKNGTLSEIMSVREYLALLDVKDFDSLDEAEKGVIAELACYMLNVNGSIMADTLITGDDELGYSNNASQWNDGTPEENMAKYFRLLLKKNVLQAWQCQDFLHRGNLTAENMANFYRYRRV